MHAAGTTLKVSISLGLNCDFVSNFSNDVIDQSIHYLKFLRHLYFPLMQKKSTY